MKKFKVFAVIIVGAVAFFAVRAYAEYNLPTATLVASLSSDSPGPQTVYVGGGTLTVARITLTAQGGDIAINGVQLATDKANGLADFSSIQIYDTSDNTLMATYPIDKQNPEIVQFPGPIIIGNGFSKTYLIQANIIAEAAGTVRLGFGGFTYATVSEPQVSGVPVYGNVLTLPNAAPSATPTPSITPTPSPTPTITANEVSQDTLATIAALKDGDLIRETHNTAVWVIKRVGDKIYKRWLIAPQILNAYGHLKNKPIQIVTSEVEANIPSSYLVRRAGDAKVYEIWDIQEGKAAFLRWIPTEQDFIGLGFDFKAVFTINDSEYGFYQHEQNLVAK